MAPPIVISPQTDPGPDIQANVMAADTMRRIGRLEALDSQILPALGEVSEAVKAMGSNIMEARGDIKTLFTLMNDVRISSSSYGTRISAVEMGCRKCGEDQQETLQQARLKAEALVEAERLKAEAVILEKRKNVIDRRNRFIGIIGTALASILATLFLTWIKVR